MGAETPRRRGRRPALLLVAHSDQRLPRVTAMGLPTGLPERSRIERIGFQLNAAASRTSRFWHTFDDGLLGVALSLMAPLLMVRD
jgi:hypothetical protein